MNNVEKYIVPRDSSEETTFAVVSVTYKEGTPFRWGGFDMLSALKSAVTSWMKETEAGKDALSESCCDFNIGDLAMVDDENMKIIESKIDGVEKIEIEIESLNATSNWWNFDTLLFDKDELEPLIDKINDESHAK